MIQTTTWSPDTCGCVLHYQWDDSLPDDQRVHTPVDSVTANDGTVIPTTLCAIHQTAAPVDVIDHHDLVREENVRKNMALADLAEAFPELQKEVDGKSRLDLKKISWSFDKHRNLIIDAPTVATQAKTEAQVDFNQKYDTDRVILR